MGDDLILGDDLEGICFRVILFGTNEHILKAVIVLIT